jgi:hypothetical protein
MPNPIVALVEKELESFRIFREATPSICPDQDNLYPIPFFGDIRTAEVLTLALNPAWTEFGYGRHWIPGLDARSLTTRLLHYFDLPEPPPHKWFVYRRDALERFSSVMRRMRLTSISSHLDKTPQPS